MDTHLALTEFLAAPAARPSAPAMDASVDPAQNDDYAALRAAVAQDAEWREEEHPRGAAGGGHGGEFAKKPETLLREDARDTLSKTEGQTAINASVERGLADIAKNAGPVGTSAKADIFKEYGKPVAAIRLVKNDRERFTGAELGAMIKALSEAGCENVEAEQDSDRKNEAVIFCSPPVDPDSAAESYMSEVEKTVAANSGTAGYTPTEEALESAREMAKNTDAQNPAKRIRVDFQEWSYEDGLKGEPSVVGKEEDASDGKAFNSPEDAAKWLLKTKNAGALEGDAAWFSTVSQPGGKWRTYRLTPVNFTEQEILDIDRIVSKGDKE